MPEPLSKEDVDTLRKWVPNALDMEAHDANVHQWATDVGALVATVDALQTQLTGARAQEAVLVKEIKTFKKMAQSDRDDAAEMDDHDQWNQADGRVQAYNGVLGTIQDKASDSSALHAMKRQGVAEAIAFWLDTRTIDTKVAERLVTVLNDLEDTLKALSNEGK